MKKLSDKTFKLILKIAITFAMWLARCLSRISISMIKYSIQQDKKQKAASLQTKILSQSIALLISSFIFLYGYSLLKIVSQNPITLIITSMILLFITCVLLVALQSKITALIVKITRSA